MKLVARASTANGGPSSNDERRHSSLSAAPAGGAAAAAATAGAAATAVGGVVAAIDEHVIRSFTPSTLRTSSAMTTCPGRASDATRSICRSGSPATRNSHRVPAKRYDGQRVIRFGDVALRVVGNERHIRRKRVAREAVAPSPPPPTCADASSPAPTHAFKRASGMDGLKGNRSFASVRISKAHSIARNVATPRGLGVTDRADRGAPRGGAEDAPRGPFYTSKSRGGVERCQLELKGVEGGY